MWLGTLSLGGLKRVGLLGLISPPGSFFPQLPTSHPPRDGFPEHGPGHQPFVVRVLPPGLLGFMVIVCMRRRLILFYSFSWSSFPYQNFDWPGRPGPGKLRLPRFIGQYRPIKGPLFAKSLCFSKHPKDPPHATCRREPKAVPWNTNITRRQAFSCCIPFLPLSAVWDCVQSSPAWRREGILERSFRLLFCSLVLDRPPFSEPCPLLSANARSDGRTLFHGEVTICLIRVRRVCKWLILPPPPHHYSLLQEEPR